MLVPRTPGRLAVCLAAVALMSGPLLGHLFAERRERVRQDTDEGPGPLDPVFDAPLVAQGPAITGEWTQPIPLPVDPVHLMLLHTGKLLMYRGATEPADTYTWDPETGAMQHQIAQNLLFCGGHSALPDGRILHSGGELTRGSALGPLYMLLFDPLSSTWTRTLDMQKGRYYPTNTLLGDGRTLIFAGTDEASVGNDLVEAFAPGEGGSPDALEVLEGASQFMSYYPRMHLMPSGRVLHVGPEKTTDILDPVLETWQSLPSSLYGKRTHGSSVMLPPGHEKIMIFGGRDRTQADPLATSTAEILDLGAPSLAWRYTRPMAERRMHLNSVILPDGKVLVAGGTTDENLTPVYATEMFDPASETWSPMAPMSTFRGYHSNAVLLPDGRAVWAGSNSNYSMEIFSPPYLFHGPRPVISSAPASVQYGQAFQVGATQAPGIVSAVLIRPGASTHSINMDQRYVPLSYSLEGPGTLSLSAPSEPNVAPPGYYMLFLLNGGGVPSKAVFIHLGGAQPGNRPPSVDAGAAQSIILPMVAVLNGTVADDGQPNPPGQMTVLWSKASGPGSVDFGNPALVDTTAAFTAPGTYQLRLTAQDGELNGSDTVILEVKPEGSAGYPVECHVTAAADDVEQDTATGDMSLGSTDLEMTLDVTISQAVGLRYNLVPIPRGETITAAWLQFKADEKQSGPTTLEIRGEASDSAAAFTSTDFSLTSRPVTTTSVTWVVPPWNTTGEKGAAQRSPDLSGILEEIVSRPGWDARNSLALIITGTGHRTAVAYEEDTAGAPVLHVEMASLPANAPPIVMAGLDQTLRLPDAAAVSGSADDDGFPFPPGALHINWSQESGPGIATFAQPGQLSTTVTFSLPGVYDLVLHADDGQLGSEDHVIVEVLPQVTGLVEGQWPIVGGADDAEEDPSGDVTLNSSDLEIVVDGDTIQTVGLVFQGVTIPQGATIHRAWIQFTADETQSVPTSLTLRGFASNNAASFTLANLNVSSRPRTTASASWSPPAWTFEDEAEIPQRTPDLKGILQEIVNRPGWAPGNALGFVITGSGHRTADAFDGEPAKAARLIVEYN